MLKDFAERPSSGMLFEKQKRKTSGAKPSVNQSPFLGIENIVSYSSYSLFFPVNERRDD